jgi:alpha-mannosidase
VPACGWRALQRTPQPAARAGTAVAATPALLENEHLRLRFNARGEIVSCRDKATGREWAAGPLNSFRLYRDIPRAWDAWDLDSTYKTQPVPLAGAAEIRVVAAGPLAGVLRVRRTLNRSRLEQEIRLRRDSRRVEFRTRLEWRETNKLLKVNFPTTLQANEAIHEVQFGHLRRPNHASRVFDADRFEVCQQKWTALAEENRGAAVLNDCKYGVNVEGGSLNLSLLRAPTAPDAAADRGPQEFAYAFFAWNGPFFESAVVREAYELNVPVRLLEGFAGEGALFEVDAPNVLIEAVKAAEDGSGDVVVRLYEAKRTATSCALRCGLPVRQARVCGMLEDGGKALAVNAGKLKLDFRPFEIKTLRLSVKRETNRISAL